MGRITVSGLPRPKKEKKVCEISVPPKKKKKERLPK
jgi:hypothetical protein